MRSIITSIFILVTFFLQAQLTDECKLQLGTNLGGLFDFGTELPFVDLMHNAREWYTKDVGNPADPFDTGLVGELSFRADGYPTHIPQSTNASIYEQRVATIWAITDGWPVGEYTLLWDGVGEIGLWGGHENLVQTNNNRIVFDFLNPVDNSLEMTILSSDINDPVRNIRLLMPGTESTYETEPFYSLWIEKLSVFPSVRFMDWGQTNNWGQPDSWTWENSSLFEWGDRAQMNHYTWANSKGIPYEMMIKLMNDFDLDGWVCVPHRASDGYIEGMAELFRNDLETERHLTVEYSNEIWNWIFGQAQWLNFYGCEQQNISWPEGIVPYVQNCLDIWSEVFENELDRITRVAGVQTGWQDVSNRMVNNLTVGSYDAIAPTYYFGITEEGDTVLDGLGQNATIDDLKFYTREGIEEAKIDIERQKNELADVLGVPMVFYEGGQHITPDPFGVEPTYSQVLLDIQRDTSMYNMYIEWFDFLKTIQEGDEPLQLMNFSFVSGRSAQFGSWGILESLNQDTTLIPAPKYSAILKTINACDPTVSNSETNNIFDQFVVYPNPVNGHVIVEGEFMNGRLTLLNQLGQIMLNQDFNAPKTVLNLEGFEKGTYLLQVQDGIERGIKKILVIE